MKNSITFRFGVAAMLLAVGCYAVIAGWHGSAIFFNSLPVLMMSRSEMTRPIPSRELLILAGVTFALVMLLIACHGLIPASAAMAIERVIRHPAFVLPMGMLLYWSLYRMYRRQKAAAETWPNTEVSRNKD